MSMYEAAKLPAILATEAEAARRLRLGFGFGKLGSLFGLAFAAFFLAIGHYWGALVVIVCTAGFAGNLLILRRGQLALAGNLYALLLTAGFAVLTAIEGGLAGHAIAWLACVPICACLFSGPRAGRRWCAACLGAVGVFSVFSCLGYSMPTLYPARWNTLVSAAGYLALTLFMSTLGILFETSRQRTFQELRAALDELAKKNDALFESMEKLTRSEARVRLLFENSALGVALLDGDSRVEMGNERLAELLGMDAIPKGFDLSVLLCADDRTRFLEKFRREQSSPAPPPDEHAEHGLLPKEGRGGEEFALELSGRGKRLFYFFLRCIPGSGQMCVMLDDITTRRALERNAAQREKTTLLDTLIGGIAHELNNKLTPIAGFAELVLNQAVRGENAATLSAHCTIIRDGALEAGQLITQLLQLSRPLALEMKACDLRQIVETACKVLTFRLRETHSHIELDLPPQGVFVSADAAQIKQVILNLALNALYAMESSPERRLCLSVGEDDGMGLLTVSDTGCGMDSGTLARIFDPFFTSKGTNGTGLGLSVCTSIVKNHGGEIEAESQPGQGACFKVRLPLRALELAGAPLPCCRPPDGLASEKNSRGRPIRVLVVEDEENIGKLMQRVLQMHFGCDSHVVGSVEEAIPYLESKTVDFVVSDLRLPGMTGLNLWKWLQEHQPRLANRIIIATGDAGSAELSLELKRAGIPVLHKPFTSKELIDVVERNWPGIDCLD